MLLEKIMEWLLEGLGLCCEVINEVVGGEYLLNVNYYLLCLYLDVIEGLDVYIDISGFIFFLINEIFGF